MERIKEITKICKRIQKDIDKLKKLNCFLDSHFDGISIFDDDTKPVDIDVYSGADYSGAVFFTFNTTKLKSDGK